MDKTTLVIEYKRSYKISEYARLNGVSRDTVYKWLQMGELETIDRGGSTRIVDWVREMNTKDSLDG